MEMDRRANERSEVYRDTATGRAHSAGGIPPRQSARGDGRGWVFLGVSA
jgi:hypothetical protein